jgi:hypothetical protein
MSYSRIEVGSAVVMVVFVCVSVIHAETPPATEHPAVQEVLTMVEAGLSEAVVLERVDNIGAFPDLDGTTLAVLAERGVSERVLVRMIQLEAEDGLQKTRAPAPLPEPAQDNPESSPNPGLAPGQAELRVVVECAFRITFLEVTVDGGEVLTVGKLWEGEGMAGERIRRPRWIKGETPSVAFEGPVSAGEHEIGVGFAITHVQMDDPNDEWGEYSRERYVSRGMRASGEPIGEVGEEVRKPAVCKVSPGDICEVTAILEKTRTSKLGGVPRMSVHYEVKVVPAEQVPFSETVSRSR